ncbi:MAG: sulfurtransferase [Betaproteobacteria bacterium]|nr:sulfurtransferase [Betaproteobacteria bacterium]
MFTTLISVSDLGPCLDDARWVVCDCRHDLVDTEAGRRAYRESHIPGARFVHLDEDLSAPKTGKNGRHPLPDPDRFARRLGELGISNASQVVAYDASGGYYAARLWWMLRWMGHDAVAILDGGWNAWTIAGLAATAAVTHIKPARFVRGAARVDSVTAEEIVRDSATTQRRLLDARAPNRFRGENETLDPVAGHIPGAVNRFFQLNLNSAGGFKSPPELKREFAATLGSTTPPDVIHYCGSGVTACHNLLAMEIAGLAGSRLYPGSWSEWCSDSSRPVAIGTE